MLSGPLSYVDNSHFFLRIWSGLSVFSGQRWERTSIKGLSPPGEWGGREASDMTSMKGLRVAGERWAEVNYGIFVQGSNFMHFF